MSETGLNLRTRREAAARLRCSLKTLNGHVRSGALRYVIIGHGKRRPLRMFTDGDLDALIESQTRKDVPCPSTPTRARRTTHMTSNSEVVAFTALPKPNRSEKPKP
jgi:hypothetical protein